MAATMRDLANALSLADCERIGPLRDRMLAQSRALARYRDEPGVAAAQAEVGELNSEIEALLQEECQ